ncbi:MAG: hypothetical protein ACLRWO_12315 [Clostridium butyricum]|jgi:hypothetical protein|uniref:hypothetical protein n=1 Tax=Clostridium TaxID=1485 RepID=UPI0008A2A2C6|nr:MULTISPECIES: hypothetical protein [Clostridium]MDU0323860.1 hypothetical protein [Clostridium butyricum]MDU6039290.1 hypothetical protein [Clostridium butyricum]OFS20974.1 hypothetical protein HMPREF3070_15875 [Clostridium sp. HMSC19A10]
MGLFDSKENKQEKALKKQQEQFEQLKSKYNLNNLTQEDAQTLQRISDSLAGMGFLKAGVALSFGKAEDQAKIGYLSAMIDQNFLIIKLLSDISNKLDNK